MRAIVISFVVILLALAFAVFAHHMITTGRASAALVGSAIGILLCLALSTVAGRTLKKDGRFWPRIISAAFHLVAAAFFFESLRSPDFLPSFKFGSVACGASLVLFGGRLLFRDEKKA
jgi:hypothetical protein